ncbi:MAG: Gfo/Idh/MocA family oxidoreductase [Nitrospirae bacterium]|nr:Gfo/Idh/MocA family oxidoreductase [Nitrospirota bacterium]
MHNAAKIAIVGCGLITRSAHLPAALRSPKINLIALVDSQIENAEVLRNTFALNCKISRNLSEIIDEVEGVVIATPNDTHYPIAKAILEKKVPVLIEKPITTTYEDAIKLCKLAETNNAFISVGYRTRYYPSVIMFKRLLDRAYFGRINHFHYEFGTHGGWAPVSGYNLDREKSGGGVLVVSGTHFLDRMLYWFGEPKEIIYRDDSYGGVEANCKAELFFENKLGVFTGTFFMSKTTKLKNKFILDAESYVCELSESETERISLSPKNDLDIKMEIYSNTITDNEQKIDYFQRQIEEFAENIHQRGKPTIDGWFAARSVKLIEEMYKKRLQLDEPWIIYKNAAVSEHV